MHTFDGKKLKGIIKRCNVFVFYRTFLKRFFLVKKRYYGNEFSGLAWDQMGVCGVALFYTTVHNVENQIEEALFLLKMGAVIKENVNLSKYLNRQ